MMDVRMALQVMKRFQKVLDKKRSFVQKGMTTISKTKDACGVLDVISLSLACLCWVELIGSAIL